MIPNIFFEGFLLQASLILALGAQNIFVLESGLKRRRQFLVAATCSICDALLIAIGVLGASSIFVQVPWLKIAFGIIGVIFLIYYALKKLFEGIKPASPEIATSPLATSAKQVILLSLGFSLLNPNVYLDTVILIGSYAAKFSEIEKRMIFGLGASVFSTIWFFGLAYFASAMSSLLASTRSMRTISLVSAAILLALSWKLGSDVYGWFN